VAEITDTSSMSSLTPTNTHSRERAGAVGWGLTF